MKQQITFSQWNDLSEEEKKKWWKSVGKETIETYLYENEKRGLEECGAGGILLPNIGQMIEFLGDEIENDGGLLKNTNIDGKLGWQEPIVYGGQLELCDALWEAVRHKLK